jgi:hypothetical protein
MTDEPLGGHAINLGFAFSGYRRQASVYLDELVGRKPADGQILIHPLWYELGNQSQGEGFRSKFIEQSKEKFQRFIFHLRLFHLALVNFRVSFYGGMTWWAWRDSNSQPSGYEPPALTIELQAPAQSICHSQTAVVLFETRSPVPVTIQVLSSVNVLITRGAYNPAQITAL